MEYDAKAWLRCGRCCANGGAVGRRGHTSYEYQVPRTCEGLNGASVEPGTGAEGISGAANCLSLHRSRKKRTAPRLQSGRESHGSLTIAPRRHTEYAAFTGCERRQRFSCSARTGKYLKVEVFCHRMCATVCNNAQPLHNSSGVSLNLGSETRPCLAYM